MPYKMISNIMGDEDLKAKKIIGSQEDVLTLRGIARIDALQNLTNADIREAVLDFSKKR